MSEKDPIAELKEEAVSSPPAPVSCPPPVSSRPGDRVSGASPETLGPTNSAASADGRTFSQLLAGAMAAAAGSPRGAPILAIPVETAHLPVVALPCFLAPATFLESERFTGQFATLATVTAQAVLATVTAQAQIHLQAVYPSSSETLTTPQPLQQRPPQTPERNASTAEAVHSPSWDEKSQNAQIIVKTRSSSDGYNWRKYGQKQVKSSDRSRSYYRCTSVDCSAKKKVERCPNGRETEIVFRGQHNHEPPQMTRCSKERGTQSGGPSVEKENLTGGPSVEKENLNLLSGEVNESDPLTSKAEHNSHSGAPDRIYCSSDCEGGAGAKVEEEHVEEPGPEPKRRLVESTSTYSPPVLKTIKEPKIVVQSASDVTCASDGYRWRKYGQKFVKGNPNPRSYYRCTHSGCPVRKHVEKASDDTKSIVITYDGKHNHDLPAFKNDSNKPAKALLIAAAAAANAKDEELHPPNYSDIKPPKDEELASDKAFELGGDKALESAHTLLSIGYNSSPEEEARATNSDGINCRPLLSKNCAAVPVQNS